MNKKIRFSLLTLLVMLCGTVFATKTVYVDPVGDGTWMADNPAISLYVFGDGDGWAESETLSDGVIKYTFDDKYTKMIIVRGNTANTFEEGKKWNQTGNIEDIQLSKLYKANGYSGNDLAYTVEDYSEPTPDTSYKVDFNTTISTSAHDFAVASNWGHIVGTNNYDGYGPYYMSYGYSADGGVDGTGALRVGAQNGYWSGSPQSQANFTDGNYDYLITPKVNGEITLQVKRYNVSGYSSYLKVFKVDETGTIVGDEIETVITPDITDSDWSTVSFTLAEEQRLAIRAQSVLIDNFTAASATIVRMPGMTISSIKRADSETTTYFDQNADGTYTVKYKVKIANTGEVNLVAGVTENYTLSVSIDGTAYGTFDVPVSVAVGETSEEFVASIIVPSTAATGWKYRYLKENLTNTTNTDGITWSNVIAYNPVPFFIKQGDEPISKGTSLSGVKSLDFGMISAESTEHYEIFAHNAGDLTIKNITVPDGFVVAPAETLPYTIQAHSGLFVDVTAEGTTSASGNMVITYVDKDGADQTLNVALSQVYVDPSKWIANFDGGEWPEGAVHESNLSLSTNSYYGYDNAVKSGSSTYNKFYTPLLHAAEGGETLTFEAMLDASYGTLNVYVTNDRTKLGETVLHLTSAELNQTSMTSKSVNVPEGDYYVVFEAYKSMFDNLFGLEKVSVDHDILINSYKIGYNAADKTIQTGDAQEFSIEVTAAKSESADAYTVKLYANDEAVATAESVELTSGTNKTFKFNWTPNVTSTTEYETYAAIEFADSKTIVSPKLKLTVTCEPIFVFFDAGTTVGTSQPSNRSKDITFGNTNQLNSIQEFEIYNFGKADLTVKSITVPEGFAVNIANASVAPATRQAVNVTFTATVPDTYEGKLTIVYVDKDGVDQTFELNVSGTMLDPTKWYANFDNTTDAIKWPAGSVYQSNVSNTYRGTYSDNNYFIYNSSYTTNNIFITPKLIATEGEQFQLNAAPQSTSYDGYIKIYTSTDRETWGDPVETIEMPKGATYSETNTYVTKSVTMPAGEYYVGIQMYYAKVDDIYGLKLVEGHDWKIASSSIPTEGMQNTASTATVNILNLGIADEAAEDITVTAYVNNVAVATAEGKALPMNHKLSDAGTQLSVNYLSTKAGTFPVKLEVKAGEYSVTTDPVNVVFAEEEVKTEADMATNGTTGDVPLNLNYKNSESVTMYNAAALASAGISAGSKIKKITYKGYKTSDELTTSFQVYYKWTDDQTLAQPESTYPYAAADNGMTMLIDENHTWAKVGSSSATDDMLVLDFTESPLTYETGKSLVIYMHSYVDAYKAAYFEKSTLSSDYCYARWKDAATLSDAFSKKVPAAIHFTLDASTATLSGTVKTSGAENEPVQPQAIEGATVTLKAKNGVEYSGTTDADGNYSINVIQASLDYTLTVEAENYLPRVYECKMNGESKTQDATLYKTYSIVGDFPGFNNWGTDFEMIQSTEDPYTFTYVVKDLALEAGTYKYKLRADGKWKGEINDAYELPSSGDFSKEFVADTYTLTFTANVAGHTLELAAESNTLKEAIELAEDDDAVAVGKLRKAIKDNSENVPALRAAINQFKADNAPTKTVGENLTAKVKTAKGDWTGAGGTAGSVQTSVGTTTPLVELYSSSSVGVKMQQTIADLENGTYRVKVFATSHNARGEDGAALNGTSTEVAYVFAKSGDITNKTWITASGVTPGFLDGEQTNPYTIEDVEVANGELTIGLTVDKEKQTGWHSIQIYSLEKIDVVTAKAAYAAVKANMTAEIAAAEALKTEYRTAGVNEFNAAIEAAKAAFDSNMLNISEFEAEVAKLKVAETEFKAANYVPFDGVYYVQNVASGKFMAAGHAWGTRGIVNETGLDITLKSNGDNTVDFDSNVYNGDNHFLGSNLFMDSSSWGWAIEQVGENAYTIGNGTQFIGVDNNDELVLSNDATTWTFLAADEVNSERMAAGLASLKAATLENGVDATFLIKDANFNRNDHRWEAWDVSDDCNNINLGDGSNGTEFNGCAESYHSTFTIMQTISGAPAGIYKLTAQGFYRQDANEGDAPAAPQFFANEVNGAVPVKAGSENSMSAASASFTNGLYTIDPIEFAVTDDGMMYVGITASTNTQWVIWDNFQLTYYGNPITISEDVDYTPVDGYANVTLKRKFSKDEVKDEYYWNTFVVPFDIDNATLIEKFGANVQVAQYSEVEGDDPDNVTVKFDVMGTPAITANVPVLLKPTEAPASVTFNGVTVKAVESEAKVEGEYFDFVGSYSKKEFVTTGNYYLLANTIYKSTSDEGTFIKGTRAYLKAKEAAAGARIVYFSIGEEVTGIKVIDANNGAKENIYNLNGQKVDNAKKGLYIKNGKKVMMK